MSGWVYKNIIKNSKPSVAELRTIFFFKCIILKIEYFKHFIRMKYLKEVVLIKMVKVMVQLIYRSIIA